MNVNILVVDDEFINRKLLTVVLKKFDNIGRVLEAENGEEALTVLENNPDINFILLDIVMPKMDGVEFLKERQKVKEFNEIPVLVLSTDDDKKGLVLEEGANSFLLKPFKEDILFSEMRSLIVD